MNEFRRQMLTPEQSKIVKVGVDDILQAPTQEQLDCQYCHKPFLDISGVAADELDAIGDIQVTLIIYCLQRGIDYKKCLADAYSVIENRKGKMIDGTFVKEEDLEETK